MVKVVNFLIGDQNKAKYPNVAGASLAVNMYTEINGSSKYQKGIDGIKYLKTIVDSTVGCKASYVASVGLTENNNAPDAFFAINNSIYRLDYKYDITELGGIATDATPIFSETGGERPLLLIADGYNIYYYDLKNGGELKYISLPERINEENVSIRPSHVQVVDGSIIVNDFGTGYTYYSKPYVLSKEKRNVLDILNGEVQYDGLKPKYKEVNSDEWVFLDDYGVQQYKNGESNSDSVLALYAVGSNLTVFGSKSVEFWQRGSSDSYSTWNRISYSFNGEIGLDTNSVYSVANVNNNVYFVSNGMTAGKGVFQISGTQFNKISPTWLDDILIDEKEQIFGYSYSVSNHSFYILQLKNKSYCYDAYTKEWTERSSRNINTGKDLKWNVVHPVWFTNRIIFGHSNDGHLFYLDKNYHMEDINATQTVPLIRQRQSPILVDNYKAYTLDEISIEMNTGTVVDYDSNPMVQLEISEDGGYTFSNTILEQCGKTGQYFYRVMFANLGMQRVCVFRFTFSENMDILLTDCVIKISPLDMVI